MAPIRILQVVTSMRRGGLETMIMNYYRNMDRTQVQFDFLVHRSFTAEYDEEILSMGGQIYRMPAITAQNIGSYMKQLQRFFAQHSEYKIVHSHIDSLSTLPLYAAKKAGVPLRIAHSHNTRFDRDKKLPLRLVSRALLPHCANLYWGCGEQAVRYMFGESVYKKGNYTVLPNAIDLNSFAYNELLRRKKRQELGLSEDTFAVGHIGRFSWQKNHTRLLDIFAAIHKQNPNSVLLLAGTGTLLGDTLKKAELLGLKDFVQYLGVCSDTNALYQALDVLVLPSHYEGLPVVGIEAQVSGLPCVFSDVITQEAAIGKPVTYIALEETDDYWAKAVCSLQNTPRKTHTQAFANAGYSIEPAAQKLQQWYLTNYRKAE
ncbi:MAG: glycosyltransferase family 1 protein [Oscillospiraceae bacterium]|nr:glycosyltransferase family 1 protein [Oscillospiraceae bacterium]